MKSEFCISVHQLLPILQREGIDTDLVGSPEARITHMRSLEEADPGCITFFIGEESGKVAHLKECVLVCLPGVVASPSVTRIMTKCPKLAFYIAAQEFGPPLPSPGVHFSALVDDAASIHASASIGEYTVIGKCVVSKGAVIHAHVHLCDRTVVGERSTVESGTCIGVTGQIWAWGLDGKRWVLPQIGGVKIGERCFIGSNISIARGALQDTLIGNGVRISHGTMIGHNCSVGRETFLSNRVALTGSVTLGDHCFVGSGAVLAPGVVIGDRISIGAGAVVTKSFREQGAVLAGVPAEFKKMIKNGGRIAGIPAMPASNHNRDP